MTQKFQTIRLKEERERSLRKLHPWVFSGALEAHSELQEGTVYEVLDSQGRFLALAMGSASSIALRVLSYRKAGSERELFADLISKACRQRKQLGQPSEATNGYRLINAEGDFLPGLIADVYGDVVCLQCHTLGMHARRELLAELILSEMERHQLAPPSGRQSMAVYDKSAESLKQSLGQENAPQNVAATWLLGQGRPSTTIRENGLEYHVSLEDGQKTGFYLDQRNNRAMVGQLSQGAEVLNLCCYTGGFSLSALCGGARSVLSLDASAPALAGLEQNLELNRFGGSSLHRSEQADVFEYLEAQSRNKAAPTFDLVVMDPPPLARHRASAESALKAYRQLHQNVLHRVRRGGLLMTFSCTQVVSRADFEQVVASSAVQMGRPMSCLRLLGAAECHPVQVTHPEGEYLKGMLLQVH
jgi:23S rRNA (cytosine1962-C5)-methyltransferase